MREFKLACLEVGWAASLLTEAPFVVDELALRYQLVWRGSHNTEQEGYKSSVLHLGVRYTRSDEF